MAVEPLEEATETDRGDISRSARSAPRADIGLNSGGGVWDRSGWVAAILPAVGSLGGDVAAGAGVGAGFDGASKTRNSVVSEAANMVVFRERRCRKSENTGGCG